MADPDSTGVGCCAQCGGHTYRTSRICRDCYTSARRQHRACGYCQQAFAPKRLRRKQPRIGLFCSKRCALSHRHAEQQRLADARRRPDPSWRAGECEVCQQRYRRANPKQRVCRKAACRTVLRHRDYIGERSTEHRTFRCRQCGEEFIRPLGNKRRAFCSTKCSRRYAQKGIPKNAQSRARRLGLPCDYSITNAKVFERDDWRCQLCGYRTPKRFKGTQNPQAPEVDHIVPFASPLCPGHIWSNVQCACRRCNADKSAQIRGQLRLL